MLVLARKARESPIEAALRVARGKGADLRQVRREYERRFRLLGDADQAAFDAVFEIGILRPEDCEEREAAA